MSSEQLGPFPARLRSLGAATIPSSQIGSTGLAVEVSRPRSGSLEGSGTTQPRRRQSRQQRLLNHASGVRANSGTQRCQVANSNRTIR